ncbi:MAG: RNA ligase [bacterium ADurb.Bin400]|nr:MAG: RNA ligase [bacterium ADurb.Bin400]
MYTKSAVSHLQSFVVDCLGHGTYDRNGFHQWARSNEDLMGERFWYRRETGMPPIYSLVSPSFHPELPLVMFNYTPGAHNNLHKYPEGWTDPIRLCRGIVFDFEGRLVALPFPKFFNYGEHPETRELPNEPFEATVKMDGHLGIIFKYQGKLLLTTRGFFTSKTAVLGNRMLAEIASANGWLSPGGFPDDLTCLVEIIHPTTRVHTDYNQEGFVLIGGYNHRNFHDFDYAGLRLIGEQLGLPVCERWQGESIAELFALVNDPTMTGQEGFVARFASGLRVKFKFRSYIAKMVESKLSYTYLMQRFLSGNLQQMLGVLPEEVHEVATSMAGEILIAASVPGSAQDKWRSLYQLEPNDRSSVYFRTICREFARKICGA